MSDVRPPSAENFLGHPKGLYVCFFTEMWERFSFYGMKALLLLYLLQHHRFGDKAGLDVLGAYGGLVYCLPVVGGVVADRWLGMRKAVVFGGALLVLGHFGMALEGAGATVRDGVVVRDAAALRTLYVSLALIIVGVGFLKPNISVIVGRLYGPGDPRRDAGFGLFYAGINLGALFSAIVCGYLGQTLGWRWGFGAAGVGMVLGLLQFLWGQRYLHGYAEPPDPRRLSVRVAGVPREGWIYLGGIVAVVPVAALIGAVAQGAFALGGRVSLALAMMIAMMLAVLAWLAWFLIARCTPVERRRMLALMALIAMCLVFFTLYEQTYGSWITFTDRLLTKDLVPALVRPAPEIAWTSSVLENLARFAASAPWSMLSLLLAPGSFVAAAALSDRDPRSKAPRAVFGAAAIAIVALLVRDVLVLPQTAGSLTYLGALFLVLLAPPLGVLWAWLGRRGREPSKPAKSAIGLTFAGLAFIPLTLAAQTAGAAGVASVWWLVLAYLLLELGEMCLSPVGLSAVTELSVPSVVSLMMGTWFLATAFSETLAALLGTLAAVEVPEGGTLNPREVAPLYERLFSMLTWVGLGFGAVAFALVPVLKRLISAGSAATAAPLVASREDRAPSS